MKNFISKILLNIYGWGIFVCLFLGGLTFLGYVIAFIIGGSGAEAICDFIFNKLFKVLIYGGNIIVILGLINMYINKEKTLSVDENQGN